VWISGANPEKETIAVEAIRMIEENALIGGEVSNHIYFPENNNFDDRFFGIDLYNKNIPMYCDTGVKRKHLVVRPYSWNEIRK